MKTHIPSFAKMFQYQCILINYIYIGEYYVKYLNKSVQLFNVQALFLTVQRAGAFQWVCSVAHQYGHYGNDPILSFSRFPCGRSE